MNIQKPILASMLMASLCSAALVQKQLSFFSETGIDISKNITRDFHKDCPYTRLPVRRGGLREG
jgi:hypothetical protein